MRKTTEFSRVKPENVWVFCGNQVRKVNSGESMLSWTSMVALCKSLTSLDVNLNRNTLTSRIYLKGTQTLASWNGRSSNHVDKLMAEN